MVCLYKNRKTTPAEQLTQTSEPLAQMKSSMIERKEKRERKRKRAEKMCYEPPRQKWKWFYHHQWGREMQLNLRTLVPEVKYLPNFVVGNTLKATVCHRRPIGPLTKCQTGKRPIFTKHQEVYTTNPLSCPCYQHCHWRWSPFTIRLCLQYHCRWHHRTMLSIFMNTVNYPRLIYHRLLF